MAMASMPSAVRRVQVAESIATDILPFAPAADRRVVLADKIPQNVLCDGYVRQPHAIHANQKKPA
jgi:hypothetical protein